MTAHFKPPRTARRPRNPWPPYRRPANVIQFRKRRFYDGWREWWPVACIPLLAFAILFAWPTSVPRTEAVGDAAAMDASSPWAGQRSAAELDAEQPVVAVNASIGAGREKLSASFAPCGGGRRFTCVIDGDTFWYRGTKIRIADINTPETSSARCPAEAALGARATARLTELLNAGSFSLDPIDRDTDRYGRKLRVVSRGGASLGAVLVEEGLAEPWRGFRRDWC